MHFMINLLLFLNVIPAEKYQLLLLLPWIGLECTTSLRACPQLFSLRIQVSNRTFTKWQSRPGQLAHSSSVLGVDGKIARAWRIAGSPVCAFMRVGSTVSGNHTTPPDALLGRLRDDLSQFAEAFCGGLLVQSAPIQGVPDQPIVRQPPDAGVSGSDRTGKQADSQLA
jgi:hypothetical protein